MYVDISSVDRFEYKQNIQSRIDTLKLFVENKTLISGLHDSVDANSNEYDRFITVQRVLKLKMPFNIKAGVCHNADTWYLDNISVKGQGISVLDALNGKFSLQKYGVKEYVYPIDDTCVGKKWKNEDRWEYIDFMIVELEKLLAKIPS